MSSQGLAGPSVYPPGVASLNAEAAHSGVAARAAMNVNMLSPEVLARYGISMRNTGAAVSPHTAREMHPQADEVPRRKVKKNEPSVTRVAEGQTAATLIILISLLKYLIIQPYR